MKFGKHKCIECGYLCCQNTERRFLGANPLSRGFVIPEYEHVTSYGEITNRERNQDNRDLNIRIDWNSLFCYRREATFENELETILESTPSEELPKIDTLLNTARKCKYYTRHITGYTPAQHLTRCEAIDRERSNRRWSLLYLIIGAILTIIGALIMKWLLG